MSMYFVHPDELKKYKDQFDEEEEEVLTTEDQIDHAESPTVGKIPSLNIVIMIVGSRGDVQPFIAFGKGLQKAGHRVRLATHVNFRDFVLENGLEFYPLKGNPEHLMNFMVSHPDMITLDPSEISRHKAIMESIYDSTWDAATGLDFHPDVLISNPPVHVHVHLAQRLQIPIVIMFTMPWSATKDYMHPLAPMQNLLDNRQSYAVVDKMIWVGLGSIINEFRKKIGLPTISRGASLVSKLRVPQVYCMSPHLAPKPTDWGNHIDVVGFWYLDLQTNYKPAKDLLDFLEAGEKPIYIGFGSIVVDNPKQLNTTVIEGLKLAGKRTLLSPGWAKLGEGFELPPYIKVIGAVPHDWLFTKCAGVIHHGGAGTTAAGLKAGCPTLVVPFFGDQPFWGSCVANMGVGPKPIPHKHLTPQKLAEAIDFLFKPQVRQAAADLGQKLKDEDGVQTAVDVFHKRLPVRDMVWQDEIYENQKKIPVVGWGQKSYTDKTGLQVLDMKNFQPHKGWEWVDHDWAPVVVESRTDNEGWLYGQGFGNTQWNAKETALDFVRKRKLIRKRKHVGQVHAKPERILVYLDVIEGKSIPSKDLVGKSDPFCVVQSLKYRVTQQTEVIDDTDAPVWKETLWFQTVPSDILKLECFDKDPVGQDFIGSVDIAVQQIIEKHGKDEWLAISDKGKKECGQIHVKYYVQK